MDDSKRIAVIGAGMAGLAAAYDLNKAGHQVVIYEGAPGSVGWLPASRRRIGIGRWSGSTTIGSQATSICWA